MSTIHTESFIAFGRGTEDDSSSAASIAMRQATALNLARAGYDVLIGANNTAATYTGFAIRPDPVAPDRNALTLSFGVGASGNGLAGIRKRMPATNKPIIFGFSIYVPADYVPGNSVTMFRVMGDLASNAAWNAYAATGVVGAEKELFRIKGDLTFTVYSDAAISSKKLGIGKLNYVECRVSDSEVRVWLDDTLVFQKAGAHCTETIALVFDPSTTNGMSAGIGTRWALSNMYFLAEDGVAPAVRLGYTTRVVGVRPTADVQAQFVRPVGPASNAAVVSQNLVDNPPLSLQSTTVGDQDIYSVNSDSATSGATLVHAVVTKALAANLESTPHSLRPFVTSGGVEVVDPRPVDALAVAAPTSRNYTACARRPTDGKLFVVGQGFSVLRSPVNGDGTQFELMADDGTAGNNLSIAFAANGTGIIGRGDGKITIIDAATDAMVTYSVGSTPLTSPINAVVITPNGNVCLFSTSGNIRVSATPTVQASWVSKVAGASSNFVDAAYNSVSNVITAVTGTAGANYQSSDQGVNWVLFTTVNVGYGGVSFDGTYTTIFNNWYATPPTLPPIFRSTDGKTSFVQVPSLSNQVAGAGFAIGGVAANLETGEQCLVGGAGGWVTSNDGVWWNRKPNLTAATVNDVCRTSAGWLIVGNTGSLFAVKRADVNSPLPALGGYQPTINSTVFDPATGTNWQPAAAAASNFGMRLTS